MKSALTLFVVLVVLDILEVRALPYGYSYLKPPAPEINNKFHQGSGVSTFGASDSYIAANDGEKDVVDSKYRAESESEQEAGQLYNTNTQYLLPVTEIPTVLSEERVEIQPTETVSNQDSNIEKHGDEYSVNIDQNGTAGLLNDGISIDGEPQDVLVEEDNSQLKIIQSKEATNVESSLNISGVSLETPRSESDLIIKSNIENDSKVDDSESEKDLEVTTLSEELLNTDNDPRTAVLNKGGAAVDDLSKHDEADVKDIPEVTTSSAVSSSRRTSVFSKRRPTFGNRRKTVSVQLQERTPAQNLQTINSKKDIETGAEEQPPLLPFDGIFFPINFGGATSNGAFAIANSFSTSKSGSSKSQAVAYGSALNTEDQPGPVKGRQVSCGVC